MASAGQAATTRVEEVLRARSNARRIKEHYEGTIGVPSGLQSLSHLLTHDKEAVFSGLEHLPSYNKTFVPPEQLPLSAPQRAPRRRAHPLPYPNAIAMPSFSSHQSSAFPRTALEAHPWEQGISVLLSSDCAAAPSETQPQPQEQLQEAQPTLPPQGEQYPLEPSPRSTSGPRVLLPSGFTLDPWRWTPPGDSHPGEAMKDGFGAGEASGNLGWLPAGGDQPQSPTARHSHMVQLPYHHSQAQSPQRCDSPTAAASPPSSRHTSPLATRTGTSGGFTGLPSEPHMLQQTHHQQQLQIGMYRSGTGSGSSTLMSYSTTGCGGAMAESAPSWGESDEDRKIHLARHRLLSANDLTPQEWARIGRPQDSVDLEKFTARNYSLSVDYDKRTLQPQRVARPDIFRISDEEAHRRQLEAFEAARALQEMRRAEEEAAALAAEQERVAQSAVQGPKYDAFGVLQVERDVSPVRPRFLDWHPGCVSSVDTATEGVAGGGGWTASRSRPGSATSVLYGRADVKQRSSAQGPFPTQTRQMEWVPGSNPDVYENVGDDQIDSRHETGIGAAYGTHPPWRRHHSATASGSLMRPVRPAGVSDAHFAQMVRQQRKWLNAPAQPAWPASAAPPPAPLTKHYVRVRSSRPWPEGTAAAIPSRVATEMAAQAAAQRPHPTSLGTVIHARGSRQLTSRQEAPAPLKGRSARALVANTPSAHNLLHAISAAFPSSAPKRVGAQPVRRDSVKYHEASSSPSPPPPLQQPLQPPQPATSRPASREGGATAEAVFADKHGDVNGTSSLLQASGRSEAPPRIHKRMSLEFRQPVTSSLSVGGDGLPRTSAGVGDAPAPGGSPASTAVRHHQTSSSVGFSGLRSSTRQQSQSQPESKRSSIVTGETLPSEGQDSHERYPPHKFEVREAFVLDGYMGR